MYMDGRECRQLEEMKGVPVGGEGRREFGEPSNGTPTVDGSHNIESVCLEKVMECNESMMTITTKGNTPYICLCNMQADIMENSPETPDIEHSTVVAKNCSSIRLANNHPYWNLSTVGLLRLKLKYKLRLFLPSKITLAIMTSLLMLLVPHHLFQLD